MICLFCGEKIKKEIEPDPVVLFNENKRTKKIKTGYMHKKCMEELKEKR